MQEAELFGETHDDRSVTKTRVSKQCRSCLNFCIKTKWETLCKFHVIRCGDKEYRTTYPYGKCPEYKQQN